MDIKLREITLVIRIITLIVSIVAIILSVQAIKNVNSEPKESKREFVTSTNQEYKTYSRKEVKKNQNTNLTVILKFKEDTKDITEMEYDNPGECNINKLVVTDKKGKDITKLGKIEFKDSKVRWILNKKASFDKNDELFLIMKIKSKGKLYECVEPIVIDI